MPQNVREWLPPEHLCWKVLDAVEQLDLSAFEDSYRGDGQGGTAYAPASLIALLLYCYSKGVRSSRRIEQACWDDVGCRIITANRRVDHSTVARFVRRHRAALNSLFVQVLSLCGRLGLVDLSAVAVDGSPMEANASRDANQRLQRLEETISQCEREIHALLEDAVDHARSVEVEDSTTQGDREDASDNWARLSRLCDRLTRAHLARERLYERALPSPTEIRIKVEAAERMVARAEKRLAAVTEAHQERLKKYEVRAQQDRAAGHRGANGRPPVSMGHKTVLVRQRTRLVKARAWLERARTPRPSPSPESRACLSDPDSRLIPGKRGGYLQGYNIQIVCARRQFLLAIEAHDNPSDRTALVPMVNKTQHNHLTAGLPGDIQLWLADSGYASAASFEALADLPLLVSVTSDADQAGFPARRQQAPAGQQDMAARLATPTGRAQYRQRSALVEPGFAQLFQRFGRHLNYRGRQAVDTEIKLLGAVHNLNKLINYTSRSSP
ncbi:transposase [Streptomyces xanthochromogenes]|uniref:transposase n=1 Tax=Streptomyces xanthochromogenes TaxID=67384 RepID=UPI003817AE34